jgi:hypothetical protein
MRVVAWRARIAGSFTPAPRNGRKRVRPIRKALEDPAGSLPERFAEDRYKAPTQKRSVIVRYAIFSSGSRHYSYNVRGDFEVPRSKRRGMPSITDYKNVFMLEFVMSLKLSA